MSESFKNRKYLKKILYQFDYIGKNGAVNEKTDDCVNMYEVNNAFFVVVPDTLRRCYFLSSTEKDVLWELISWANVDAGFCKVLQGIISQNISLSISTVKSAINSLVKKGLVEKRKVTKRENLYRIADMSKNPYILVSEAVHYYLRDFIESHKNNDYLYKQDLNCAFSLSVEAYIAGVNKFINTPKLYLPIIESLQVDSEAFTMLYKQVMKELHKVLDTCYNEMFYEICIKRHIT